MLNRRFFSGRKVVITVGPTREYIDSVRFISNASSGKMGLALARAFRRYGAEVFLICGPGVVTEKGFAVCAVTSARDLLREAKKNREAKKKFTKFLSPINSLNQPTINHQPSTIKGIPI